MKKIISEIPLRISLLSIIAMASIIVMFICSVHLIKIKDVVYTGAFNNIQLDKINPNNEFQISFQDQLLSFENIDQLKIYIKHNKEQNSSACKIIVERKLVDYFFM